MEAPKNFKDFINNLKNNYHDINATREHLEDARTKALMYINEYKDLKKALIFYENHLNESLKYIDYLQTNNK